jgi:hypothetical protein
MKLESGKVQMAKLARIKHRQAELHGELALVLIEEAKIFDAMAEGETVDLRTGKLRPKFRKIELPEAIAPEDRASAIDALRENDLRRRASR